MALILAGLLGVFISLAGAWFITSPFNAVQAFGVDPSHLADIALAPGLGVRDVALGLIIIGFALARKPAAHGRRAAHHLDRTHRRLRHRRESLWLRRRRPAFDHAAVSRHPRPDPGAQMTYWFMPKRYWIGATPANRKGWLVTVGFIAIVTPSSQCSG